jgi:hypothetical protein
MTLQNTANYKVVKKYNVQKIIFRYVPMGKYL